MTLDYLKGKADRPQTDVSATQVQVVTGSWVEVIGPVWRRYRVSVIASFALNLLAFGYLYFTYIYTNHVFPNIIDQGFPSFRTRLEGRWGSDLIYFLQGSRGIPLLDLTLAVPIQIANGGSQAVRPPGQIDSRRCTDAGQKLSPISPLFRVREQRPR